MAIDDMETIQQQTNPQSFEQGYEIREPLFFGMIWCVFQVAAYWFYLLLVMFSTCVFSCLDAPCVDCRESVFGMLSRLIQYDSVIKSNSNMNNNPNKRHMFESHTQNLPKSLVSMSICVFWWIIIKDTISGHFLASSSVFTSATFQDGHVAWEAMKFNRNLLVVPEVNYTLHDGTSPS